MKLPTVSLGARRILVGIVGIIVGVAAVAAMHFLLPEDYANVVLNKPTQRFLADPTYKSAYPFSIQNLMWIIFFVGLGEILVRYAEGKAEMQQIGRQYLPEDERTVLRAGDLGKIYKAVRDSDGGDVRFLPRLIHRVILQFQSSRSVDQANSLLNSSMEMYLHEIDLRYNMLRYVMWLIPTLGFIGTVVGIADALGFAGSAQFDDPELLSKLTARLGVAFFTTLLALLLSAVLVFLVHIIQAREERSLNLAGQYCLDNLINRLYER
ncbi:MAG: MotA/TolQ/ExbB proton channel family protein [Alphaproteobacteria bacterium]|nr:MotA/TolQ/ExbB proton channel family protein [Alphaproteobacteria bacterium]